MELFPGSTLPNRKLYAATISIIGRKYFGGYKDGRQVWVEGKWGHWAVWDVGTMNYARLVPDVFDVPEGFLPVIKRGQPGILGYLRRSDQQYG